MHATDMIALGELAPSFSLPDLDGVAHDLDVLVRGSNATVVVFSCNHCPYVQHVEDELGRLAGEVAAAGVAVVAICPNDVVTHPTDDVPGLRDQVRRAGWGFPYLVDTSQEVARAWGAACTPDFFVLDGEGRLAYRGAMDESSPGNGKANDGAALRTAIDHVLRGEEVPPPHVPPMGCGIKWRAA